MPSEDYGAVGLDEIIGLEEIIGQAGLDDEDADELLEEIISGPDDDDEDEDEDEIDVGEDDDDDEDDDEDEVGQRRRFRRPRARRRRAPRRRRRPRMSRLAKMIRRLRAARVVDPRAVTVRKQRRDKRRRLLVPVPVTTIAAGASAEVSIQPQRLFKCKRMIFPSSIADDFRFTDIKVGQQSQFAASGDVPAGAFSEVTVDGYVDFDSADIGNLIVFETLNTDAVNAHTLEGVLLGTAVV